MKMCECGNMEFEAKMITTAIVEVAAVDGCPQHILGTEDTQTIDYRGPFICKKCGKHHLSIDDPVENDTGTGRRCACGNTKFLAHQRSYHDVFVYTDNIFLDDNGIYESERPYGPFTCTECGAEYAELEDLDKQLIAGIEK